ncbi:MAG: GNAT family N-acetyltransferase [Flavobacteriia bacterium]|nr:GNAT family N-acetyltransferase [Flavobacteriia bacterium]
MRIIERKKIDIIKWDALVEKHHDSTIFNLSVYLDSVAENWCVLVDEYYTCGIALPYTIRLGVKQLYTPIFGRYVDVIGRFPEEINLIDFLKRNFLISSISIRNLNISTIENQFIYQEIKEKKLNSQAKRMLLKFQKSNVKIEESNNFDSIHEIVERELSEKVTNFKRNTNLILSLIHQLSSIGYLKSFAFYENESLVGGMFFMEYKNRVVYLKGAAEKKARDQGVMYKCMDQMIDYTLQANKVFDFGGSRVEGVRRFNMNFGGVDVIYVNLHWNNASFCWKLMQKIKFKLLK